jgi:hypothetical protein
MSARQIRVYRLPAWLVLLIALPLGAVFLTSLIVAAALAIGGAALAALLLPRLARPTPTRDDAIELDPSQFHRVDDRRRSDRE